MSIVYCEYCKIWVDNDKIEPWSTAVSFGQIDPPDEYGIMPCCDSKVPWDDIEEVELDEIIDMLNEIDAENIKRTHEAENVKRTHEATEKLLKEVKRTHEETITLSAGIDKKIEELRNGQ